MSKIGSVVGRALRETGQAMDRLALKIEGNEIFRDTFTRHRAVMGLFGKVCRRLIAHQRKKNSPSISRRRVVMTTSEIRKHLS
jgi:hypothetical protein